MTSFNLGKAVKKWLQQKKSYKEISAILGKTPEECIEAYRSYMGLSTPIFKSSDNLEKLILQGKKLHIYGESGVGKSYIVNKIANKFNFHLFVSLEITTLI